MKELQSTNRLLYKAKNGKTLRCTNIGPDKQISHLFSKKVWVIRAAIHKLLVRIANREDTSEEIVCSWSALFVKCFVDGNWSLKF